MTQRRARAGERSDALIDLAEAAAQQVQHLRARDKGRRGVDGARERLLDLLRRQPRIEQPSDLADRQDVTLGVLPVAVGASRRLEQLLRLVIAQQVRTHACSTGQLAYPHGVPLDLHTDMSLEDHGMTVPHDMAAVTLDRFGGVETLTLTRLPVPEVGDGDVLIRVETAGVGSWDAVEREGAYDGLFGMPPTFPYVLGWDAAGTVAAVGAAVTRIRVGDPVYAATMPLPRGGCYADFVAVEQDNVAPLPDGLSIEEAGAMPWDALTALSGLDTLQLNANDTLLVLGASGGIGHLAVQLARHAGARVLAVASGQDGVELATRLGAEAVLDGRREDVVAAARAFAPAGLDAALLTVGGAVADRALTAVRAGGRAAVPNGVAPQPQAGPGVQLLDYDGARGPAATDRLNRLIAAGAIKVHLAAEFSLEQVADAHRMLQHHYLGKLVLRLH